MTLLHQAGRRQSSLPDVESGSPPAGCSVTHKTQLIETSVLSPVKMPNQNTTQVMTTGPTPKTIIPKVRYHPTIQTQTAGGRAQATTRAGRTANHCPQIGTNRGTARENQDAGRLIQGSPVGPRPEGTKKKKQKPVLRVEPGHLPTPEGAPGGPGPSPRGLGVQLDGNTVADVEVLTRGQQANPEWFTWRKNRITASVAHSIARCRFSNGKSKTPPKSYLAAVTGRSRPSQTGPGSAGSGCFDAAGDLIRHACSWVEAQ